MQRWLYILTLLLSAVCYGQVHISLDSDKTEYNGKEIINLTIVLEVNGPELNQDFPTVKLPDLSKFNFIGNGSVNNTFIDPATNTQITQKIIRVALEPKQKGKIKIGSAIVTVNEHAYKTEPFDIYVKEVEKKSAALTPSEEVYLAMEVRDRDVYKDQPTIAILKAYSRNIGSFRRVKDVHLPQDETITVKPINMERSEIDPTGFRNMPSQVLAVFMIFPNEVGNVDIPPASATVISGTAKATNKIASNKVRVNVRKLPEGNTEFFKNAVGTLEVDLHQTSTEKIEINKPINVSLIVKGEGNLENMYVPAIEKSTEYEVYPPKLVFNTVAGMEGLKGEVIANYVIIPKKTGAIQIKTENFTFFNPNNETYVNVEQKILQLNAFSHDEILEARSTVERVNEYTNTVLETVNTPVLTTTSLKVKEKSKLHWNILMANIALLLGAILLFYLYKRWERKRKEEKKNQLAKQAVSLGSVEETEQELREKHEGMSTNEYFAYLETLKEKGEYSKFFEGIAELDANVRSPYQAHSIDAFRSYIEAHFGSHLAEQYHNLHQRIQMEKYAPTTSPEGIEMLFQNIVNLYSQLKK